MSGGKSLVGKLLLSTALVAVTLAYGWWQRQNVARPGMTAAPVPAAPDGSARNGSAMTLRAPPAKAAAPQTEAPVSPTAPSGQDATASPPLTAMAELSMYLPPPPQTPLPLITGTPASGVSAPPHLIDGDYLGDMQQFEWGVLQVKIQVRGGQIAGAQLVRYPDHRADSLEISERASPLLNSELIQTQHAKVDIVSSATETSYVYRDAATSALMKATRQ